MAWWTTALSAYKAIKDTGWKYETADTLYMIFGISMISDIKTNTSFVIVSKKRGQNKGIALEAKFNSVTDAVKFLENNP